MELLCNELGTGSSNFESVKTKLPWNDYQTGREHCLAGNFVGHKLFFSILENEI